MDVCVRGAGRLGFFQSLLHKLLHKLLHTLTADEASVQEVNFGDWNG